ncbi:multidrug DMT transporter permease [Colwellia sp. MEBiC06753]
MFHSNANGVIRLVFTPLLVLFGLHYYQVPLPIVAPIFIIIFLTTTPTKPPISLLVKIFFILAIVSTFLTGAIQLLRSSVLGLAIFTWLIFFISFSRSHSKPDDIAATLLIIIMVAATVLQQQYLLPLNNLSWMLMVHAGLALASVIISYWLFPGADLITKPKHPLLSQLSVGKSTVVLKTTVMFLVLEVLVLLDNEQSLLIAVTLGSLLKVPNVQGHHTFSKHKLLTTIVGMLFTIPVLLVSLANLPLWLIYGISLFCALQLVCFAIRMDSRLLIYQLLLTNFIILINDIIQSHGAESLFIELLRLSSIIVAIIIGATVVNLTEETVENLSHHEPS